MDTRLTNSIMWRNTLLAWLLCVAVVVPALAQQRVAEPDLSSPRATVTTFLAAMNEVNAGQPERMEAALVCLYLEDVPDQERDVTGPERARQLYGILDSQTIFLEDLPDDTENPDLDIPLPIEEDAKLSLHRFDDGRWRFNSKTIENIPAYADLVDQQVKDQAEENDEIQVDARLASPRATMRTFIEGMNRWEEGGEDDVLAAMDLSEIPEAVREERGIAFAENLKGILDRFPLVVYQTIPDTAEIRNDETYAYIVDEDIQLTLHKIRSDEPSERVWKFSPSTLDKLQETLDRVRDRALLVESHGEGPKSEALRVRNWVADNFPVLLQKGVLFEHWQWIGLFIVIFTGMVVSRLFVLVTTFFLGRLFRRGNLDMDQEAKAQVKNFARPVRLMFMAWVWLLGLRVLNFDGDIYSVLFYAVVTITYGGAIWAGWSLIDLVGSYLRTRARATSNRFDDLLVPLIVRSLQTFVVVAGSVAIIAAISPESYGKLLAGLGIGGLAFALAAKDTIANLFGSVMIIADRPFEIGDWIQVGDVDGSVESVGIRSTRIRTFYNSLITIPNSELTNATIDNYGKRKYRRIKTTLGLTYDTPPEKIEAFCEGVRQLIREHPYTRKDYFHVYFNEFSAYSLDIMLYCFVETPEWSTELRERHRLLLDILRLADRLGVEFAFPTETEHVRTVETEKLRAEEMAASTPASASAARSIGREHAASIMDDTIGRGTKPPPVDFDIKSAGGDSNGN